MSFVHLHTHSEYSLLDGANRLSDLIVKAQEFEMPALALTDHGCMYGAWNFQKMATKAGVKPIIGMEAYVAPGDRRDRTKTNQGGHAHYHLVLLARDLEGYRNLIKLTSIGYTEGFYYRPRVDRETLARHSDGLIVTSACMAGELARHLTANDETAAREVADWYANVFPDRYYLEVQGHGTPGQAKLNQKILTLADDLSLPVVATNDTHFLQADHHGAHDILVCIGTAKTHDDTTRLTYDDGLYFKNPQEMAEAFPDRPDVIENTLKIADEVSLSLERKYRLPQFNLPEPFKKDDDYLVHLAEEGAKERYGEPLSEEIQGRLKYELDVILKTGYAGYFLVTWDFVRWARQKGIPVGPGRGSAAGSLVSYALKITNLDPLSHGLLFERFLNPERISMPDIDIDFCYERRGEVIKYVRKKYGRDAVGQIITFGTMKSRAVIRDVGRVLGFEVGEMDRAAKMIPNQPGKAYTVKEAIAQIQDVKALYRSDERYKKLFDYSVTLEGLSRHASVHAAGVVIAPGPLDDYVPICTQDKGTKGPNGNSGPRGKGAPAKERKHREPEDGPDVVTQYDMNCLEDAGMLKMDFLGLKTLTVICDAVQSVKARTGKFSHPITGVTYQSDAMDDVPLDDAEVYRMLAKGGTSGVFQFESNLAQDKLRAMRCDRFDDLVATNALIRPGPLDSGMTDAYIRRKVGAEKTKYPVPALEPVLKSTYGIIVYQEQVMRIASDLAGYSLGDADVLRKAMGKKDAKLIKKELERFKKLAMERGLDQKTANTLADQIKTFGRYGFNKSHSAAYSLLSYQTAWMKRYYPAEFMAALLSSVLDKTDDVVKYMGECSEMGRYVPGLADGLQVLPPDVNECGWKFTVVEETTIRFGLGAVRGVGSAAVQAILDARKDGPFESLADLLDRTSIRALNKRMCEQLISAGALDSLGERSQLVAGLDIAYSEAQTQLNDRESGQGSLFGGADTEVEQPVAELPNVPAWPERDRLTREKEALGFFISGHPLDRYRAVVNAFDEPEPGMLAERMGRPVEMCCVVTALSRQVSKKTGAEWAKLTVEGFRGTATVLAFGGVWQATKETLVPDAPVLVRGRVSDKERDEDDPPVFLDEAEPLNAVANSGRLAVRIELEQEDELDANAFGVARSIMQKHAGRAPVEVVSRGANGRVPNGVMGQPLRSRSLRVAPDNDALTELENVFGRGQVSLRLLKTPIGSR